MEHLRMPGENIKWCSHSGKQLGTFLKKKRKKEKEICNYHMTQELSIYPREMKADVPTKTCT